MAASIYFLFNICYERKPWDERFPIPKCNAHVYCMGCMALYAASKLQDNIIRIPGPSPGCAGSLAAEHYSDILPREVYERWCDALCEAAILGSERTYCPFKDCSALWINNGGGGGDAGITEAECPNCWRLFRARCKVPWHSRIGCHDFQKLNKDEMEEEEEQEDDDHAKEKCWRRCPRCGIFIEKIDGCKFMACRWCSALCEAAILGSERAYCPFKDCSALLINDGGGDAGITEAECPNCWRLFCALCKVPWHSGIGCQDFQKLNKGEREKEHIMLMNLAKEKRWRRCPQCGIFVEKIFGCKFMIYRCRSYFCYDCGAGKKGRDCRFCTCKR